MNKAKALPWRGGLWWVLLFSLLASVLVFAAPQFPALSGRVVDQGNFLSPAAENQISQQLKAHEDATTNQVVVVTLPDLQGYSIEDFGYQLGRHWGIGQKDMDNGALLLVSRAERKIRIEVGYGLEGTLTDAISSNIINTVITPAFKKGKFEEGIKQGTTAIIDAIGGQYQIKKPAKRKKKPNPFAIIIIIVITIIVFFPWPPFGGGGFGRGGYYGGGFGRGGGFGGGGFGGGGGGFGGGGASGGW